MNNKVEYVVEPKLHNIYILFYLLRRCTYVSVYVKKIIEFVCVAVVRIDRRVVQSAKTVY